MIELDPVPLTYLAVGVATLLAALLPRLLRAAPLSMPILFVAAGIVVFALIPDLPDPDPDPLAHTEVAVHLTELCVIISLMGAGLALNRPLGWRRWSSTWRLLGITMPLSMIAVGLLGWTMLGLGVAAAVLIAAVLAPTDPVLASEVQVSKPAQDPEHDDDEVRFALTSEAGLNDGLAFLFTWAAVGIAIAGIAPSGWLGHWLAVDLVWRIAAGVGVGAACGWLLGRMLFSTASERRRITDGAHGFIEQIERLLTVAVLVLVGGAVSRGALEGIGLIDIVFVAAVLLVVRPLAGSIGLAGGVTRRRERMVIAFFGVRGVGSLFYLAFALQEANFPGGDRLWAVTLLAVLGSVIVHGITATPAMRSLDRRHGRLPEEPAPA